MSRSNRASKEELKSMPIEVELRKRDLDVEGLRKPSEILKQEIIEDIVARLRAELTSRDEELHAVLHEIRSLQLIAAAQGQDPKRAAYYTIGSRLRDLVRKHTRPGSIVLVVSKGDDDLLSFYGRR